MPEAILPKSPLVANIPNAAYPTAGQGLVLETNGLVNPVALGTGTRTGAKFLRDDQTWQTVSTALEVSYTQGAADVTVAGTTSAAPTSLGLISGSIATDGTTPLLIHFFSYRLSAGGSGALHLGYYEDGTFVTEIGQLRSVGASALDVGSAFYLRRTPAAGSHTFNVQAWRDVTNGTIFATGAAPFFLRVSKAL